MPFVIKQRGDEHCVYTQGEDGEAKGDPHGCHPTREKALAQMRALYANVPEARKAEPMILFGAAVKAMGDGLVGGYLIQYGSEATKDAEGEWFTEETDFDTEFPARTSVYYHHGFDPSIGRERLTHGTLERDAIGVKVAAKLDMSNPKHVAIYRGVERGEMGWSSGSLPHITIPPRERAGGAIKQWPLGHDSSLTRIPADRRNAAVAIKSAPLPPVEELIPACECGGVKSTSLAENTERWLDAGETLVGDYRTHAVKAGRKLSAARRGRLMQMRAAIDEMLSDTELREEAAAEEVKASPTPVTGGGESGKEIVLPISVPDISDLYAAAVRQSSGPILSGRI